MNAPLTTSTQKVQPNLGTVTAGASEKVTQLACLLTYVNQ